MSHTDWTITAVGISQMLFGVALGYLRWGRHLRKAERTIRHLRAVRNAPVVNYGEWRREHFGREEKP